MKDYNGKEIRRMEVYVSVMVDVSGMTEREAYAASEKTYHRIEDILYREGIALYDTYEVFRDENDEIMEPKRE